MSRHYFVLAIKVLLRRKFFTFISLFGISFTLLVLMIVTAMLDHAFAPAPPETRQRRTLGLFRATIYGEGNQLSSSGVGFRLIDQHARNLPGVEALSIFRRHAAVSYVGGQRIELTVKRTDGEFWRILQFTFVEGAPYSSQDFAKARPVAVINRATRTRLFGDQPAVGKTLETDGERFQIVGVVQDVSEFRTIPFSDVWVPYTTARSEIDKTQFLGDFQAIALARDESMLPQIKEEFNSRLARVEPSGGFTRVVAPFETGFEVVARGLDPISDRRDPESQGWKLQVVIVVGGLLFILLPTINLININMSRILERASEIGVRKSFGASSRTLVGQFVMENVLLTLVGGLIGLVLTIFVLGAFNESGVIRHAELAVNVRVFCYGMLLALAFGLISGVYPAWRMSRLEPASALNGGRVR